MEKCKVCGREFSRLVNKNMHEKYCKGGKNNSNTNTIINKKKTSNTNKVDTNNNKCEHDFILLNDRVENQRQAIAQGYNAYCKKCDELT